MTEERWQRIHDVFQAALEQPVSERTVFLDAVCADDGPLRIEVESLLGASAPGGRFDRLSERFVTDHAEDPVPDRIGPYRLMRELGRGGMGVVYLAVRTDDQLHQPVALKVLHADVQRRDLVEHFLAERQILAQIDHPHIARVYFGGMTDSGPGLGQMARPYFALEYVDGEPITDYCDGNRLTTRDRLRLFLDVCEAVQHAHQHLVVHRDLKPSNILVTGTGVVKLVDFGIAKILDQTPPVPRAPHMPTGVRLMTPAYASPEQVHGATVTTATDVYLLGVLLYELITGRRPYQLSDRSSRDADPILFEQAPEQPSTVVTRAEHEDAKRVSQSRSTTARLLHHELTGDLDAIVLKAIRREPNQRYPSVESLGDDVRRYLGGLPVRARPDTLVYRASKFVHRHRLGVLAAGVIVALTLGFGVAMAIQSKQIAEERDRTEEATRFVIGLFEDFDPVQARGGTLSTRRLLDERATRVQTEFRTQPLMKAKLLHTLGQIYRLRGEYPEAERLLRDALALRQDYLEADHLDVAESQYYVGLVLSEKDAYVEAEPLLRAALETYRRALGSADLRTALVLEELAIVHRSGGDLAGAEALFRELLATYRANPGTMETGLATTLLFLGKVRLEQGHFAEAEPLLQEALALQTQINGEEHPAVANTLDGLGELAHAQREFLAAERYYLQAYAIRQRLYEPGHSDFAASLTNLGIVLHDQERYDAAEPLLRQAYTIAHSAFGDDHGLVTDALFYLGSVHAAREDWVEADSFLTASLATWSPRWVEEGHHLLFQTLDLLAHVRRKQGYLESADTLMQRAQQYKQDP